MSPVRQDHLLRMVEEAFDVIRRIRKRRQEGDLAGAARDADAGTAALLGPSAAVATRLDPATAAALLRNPEQVALWACILAEEAAVLGDAGRTDAARHAGHRALLLALEAWLLDQEERRLSPALRSALGGAFATGRAWTDPALLGPRERHLAERMAAELGAA